MFRINTMSLHGLEKDRDEGLVLRWQPEGFLIEMAKQKLEKLKEQYDNQLDNIRTQIDQVRRPSKDDDDEGTSGRQGDKGLQNLFKEAKDELGRSLPGDQKDQLDTLVSDMDRSHQQQLADMQLQHVDDVDNQVTEIRSTLEEIYNSQLELVKSELEQSHQMALQERNEEITQLEQEIEQLREATPETSTFSSKKVLGKEDGEELMTKLNEKLTKEHQEIIKRLQEEEEARAQQKGTRGSRGLDEDNVVSAMVDEEEIEGLSTRQTVVLQVGDVQQSLEEQCEEISSLRSRLLGEHERLLSVRADVMAAQTTEVEALQNEMAAIQQSYEQHMTEFENKVQLQTESSLRSDLESSHSKELEKMKQFYEKKVSSMEVSYTTDINKLKQEHQELLARLQEETGTATGAGASPQGSPEAPTAASRDKQREYVRKTMTLTAISDEEVTPPSSPPSGNEMLEGRIQALETKLKEREKIVNELKKRLEAETTSAEDLHGKLLDSNKTLIEYEDSMKLKMEEIDSLRDQLNGKDKIIKDMESEKAATEENGGKGESDSKVIAELRERITQLEKELSASKNVNKKIQDELNQLDSQHGEAIIKLKEEMDNLTKIRVEEAESGFKIQLEEEMKQQTEELENKYRDEISKQSQELQIYKKTETELRDNLEKVSSEHEKLLLELKDKPDSKKQEKYAVDSAESAIVVSEIQETESSSPSFSTVEVDRDSLEAAIRENVRIEILQEYEESIDKLKSEYESRISELNIKIQSYEAQEGEKAEVVDSEKESERTLKESVKAELALEYKEKLQNMTSQYEDKLKHLQGIVDGRRESDVHSGAESSVPRSKSVDSELVMKEKDDAKISKEYDGFVATIRRDYEDKIQTLQTEIAQFKSTAQEVPSDIITPKSAGALHMEFAQGASPATQEIKQDISASVKMPARPDDTSPEKQELYDEIALEFETSFKNLRAEYEKEISELKAKISALENEKDEIENKVREELTARYEAEIVAVKEDYDEKVTKLEADVKKAGSDKTAAEQKVKADMFVWHEETVNQLKRKHEEMISQLRREYEEKMDLTREEMQEEFEGEKTKIEQKHRQEVVELEDRYESLVEGIRTGGVPEVAEMVQEKFDMELEMAKTLIQQECDETIESETSRLTDQFDDQLKEALVRKDEELEEQKAKHEKELADLRNSLLQQYEAQVIEMQSQHQSEMTKAQLEFGVIVEKVKSESLKSETPSPKSQKSVESKTSEESSEIEEEIEAATTSTSSVTGSDKSDKDDDGGDDGKGTGGSPARSGQAGDVADQEPAAKDKPDSTEKTSEQPDSTTGSADRVESELVIQLRQEIAHKIVQSESTIAQLRMVQAEEMSQLEQILDEKEADYQKKIADLETRHEQDIAEYQATIAKLKQGVPDTDSTEALEAAHQQELQDLETRLMQKLRTDLENLETQHQARLAQMEQQHNVEVTRLQEELLEAQRAVEQYPDTITAVQEVPTFTAVGSLGSSTKESGDFMLPSQDSVEAVEEQLIEITQGSQSESMQGTGGTMSTQVFEARTSSEEKSPDASLQGTLEDVGVQSLDTSMDRSRGTLRGVDDTQDSELIAFSEEESDKSTEEADTTAKSDRSTPTVLMQTLGYGAEVPGGPTVKSLDDTTDSSIRASDREEAVSRIRELETEVADLRLKLSAELSKQEEQMDRMDREKQEESNLCAMLRADIERLNTDRDGLQATNEHLLGLLSDAVKTYMNNEELINRKLKAMMDRSIDKSADKDTDKKKTSPSKRSPGASPGRLSPARADDSDNVQETSILSNVTDEGLDLSQRITDCIFQGPDIAVEEEELMIDSGNRLRTSVTHLLDMVEESTSQLLDMRQAQSQLAGAAEAQDGELQQAQDRTTDLEERLAEEVERKDYLALELNKAQGLVEGYSSENEQLEQKIQDLEEQKETLVLELETTKNRLLDMAAVRQENETMKREVAGQQDLMKQNVGEEAQASGAPDSTVEPPSGDQALMLEVTRLNSESREKDTQLKAAHERFETRIRDLENSGEDMEGHFARLLDEKKQENVDLKLQVDALEKQLKAKKQFLEEQTGEREQEHEDYQKEVEMWKKMVQDLEKQNGSGSRLQKEVDDLTEQLQNRVDLHSQALLEVDKAQQAVRDKELSLVELKTIIQQLETELQERATEAKHDKQRLKKLEDLLQGQLSGEEEGGDSDGPAPIQAGKAEPVEVDVTESERRERLAAQLTMEEEMRQAAEKTKEELVLEKRALQNQLNQSLVQLSDVRTQLDKMRHRQMLVDRKDTSERLEAERERMEEKEKEISDLKLQIELSTEQIQNRDQQIEQLRSRRSPVEREEYEPDRELELQINALKRENKQLRERVQLSEASSVTDMSGLSQNLLEEKNQEIDELSEQLARLNTDMRELQSEKGVQNLYEQMEGLKEELKQKEKELEGGQSVRVSATFTDHSLTPDASLMNVGASFSDKTSLQQEMEESVAAKLDRAASLESEVTTLKAVLNDKEEQIAALQQELAELKEKLEQAQAKDDITMLQDVIEEKEQLIAQMTVQVDSLQTEVDNLSDFQNKLQEDFDTVQTMLEDKDKEIESLHKELTDRSLESREDHTQVTKPEDGEIKNEVEIARLRKELREKDNVIEEKLEEMAELTDKLEASEAKSPSETIQAKNEEIRSLKTTVEQLLGRPPSPPHGEDKAEVIEKQKQEIEALKVEIESLKLARPQSSSDETSDVVHRLRSEIDRLKQQIMDANLPEDDKSVLIRELRLQNDTLQKQVDAALKIRPPSPPSSDDEKSEMIHEQKREIDNLRSIVEVAKADEKAEIVIKQRQEIAELKFQVEEALMVRPPSPVRSEDEKSELIRKQEKEIGKLKKQVEAALQIAPPPPPPATEEDQEKEVTMLRAELAKVTEAVGKGEEGKLLKEKVDETLKLQIELDNVRQRVDSQGSLTLSSAEESLKEKEKMLEMKEEKLKHAEENMKTLQEELKSAKEVRAYEDEIELKEKEDEIEELQAELERYRSGSESTIGQSVDIEMSLGGDSESSDAKQLVRSMSFYKEQYEEKCFENRQLQVSTDLLKQQLEKAKIEQVSDSQTREEIEMFKEDIKQKSEEEIKNLKERKDSLETEVKKLKLELTRFEQDPDVRLISLEKEVQQAKEEAANERMDTVQAINDLEKLRERKEKERKESLTTIHDLEDQLEEKTDLEKELGNKVKALTEELAAIKKSKSPELKKSDSQDAFELGTDIGTLQQQVVQYKQQADKTKEVLAEKQKYQSQVVKLEIQYENLQKQLTQDVSALEEQLKFYQTHPEQDVWVQLKATQERLEKTSDQLTETSKRLSEADIGLSKVSEDLRNREDDMKELQQDLWKTSGQLSVTSGRLAETEEKLRLTVSQVTEREEQITQLQGELQHAQAETEQAQQQTPTAKPEEVERLKKQLSLTRTELEEMKKSLKEAVEMSEQQLQMVETKDQEYVKLKLDIQQTIAAKDKTIREQKNKIKESEQEVQKTKQEASKARQEVDKVKQETDVKDQQVSQLSASVTRLQDQVSQAAGDGASVAALRAQLQNQEEMIAELRKNEEFRKEETEQLQNNLVEFRKHEDEQEHEKDITQNRIDSLQRELEHLRSSYKDLEERSRSGSRGQSPHDQNGSAGRGPTPVIEDGVIARHQERSLESTPQGHAVAMANERGQELARGTDLGFSPETQMSLQNTRGEHDSGYSRTMEQHSFEDNVVQSMHREPVGSAPGSQESNGSRGSQGSGSPHGSRGHRSPPGSAGSGSPREYDARGLPVEVDVRSSRTESLQSIAKFDMSTSPPVREPKLSKDSRSPQSSEPRPQSYDGQSRSPSRSDGHRSPPGDRRSSDERSPPHSGGRSPHGDRRSPDSREHDRSPHSDRGSPRDRRDQYDRSPPHDDTRSPVHHDTRSAHGERRSPQDRRDYDGRSPPHDDRTSPARHDTRSPQDERRSPRDRRDDYDRSPPHDDTRSPSRSDGKRSPTDTRRPTSANTRSPTGSERDSRQLYERDDNIRPRYAHSTESQPRSQQSPRDSAESVHRSTSAQGVHFEDEQGSLTEGLPSEAERYIQQLRRELLITKTALMQIQKGGNLDRDAPDDEYVHEAMTQAQDALQQEGRPGEAGYRVSPPRDRSGPRYETLPDEDRINRLQRDLDRAEEELELYRTSSNLSARDFVQKVMNLKDELSSEHARHISELQTRSHQDGEAQLEALRLRYEDELAQLKRLHGKEVEQRLNELQLRLERKFKGEMNKERVRHTEEVQLLRSRIGVDIDDTGRLGERQGGVGQDRNGTAMVNGHAETEPMSSKLQEILRRLHSEGVQVLSISELMLLNRSRSQAESEALAHQAGDPGAWQPDLESLTAGWENERQAMISTIQSLKDLLAQTHKLQGLDKSADGSDWRAELLRAIGYVFTKERESQLAELRSHALSHPGLSIDEIQRLEQHIRNMESHHHSALDQIFGADRQSLLSEIRDLRAHTAISRLQHQEERERMNDQLTSTDEQAMKKERQLKRQDEDDEDTSSEYEVQLLEFKIQQEKVLQDDLRTSLDSERFRSSDLNTQLTREKDSSLELQTSMSGLQVQVARLKESLEREQSRYVSVTNALEEEKTKSLNLSDLLEAESQKLWQAQQQLEELKRQQATEDPHRAEQVEEELAAERELRLHLESSQEIGQVTIDNLKKEVEMGKRHLQEVEKALENERHLSSRLQQSLDAEKSSSTAITDRERTYIKDLQGKLKSEQAKVAELGCMLDREQETREDESLSVQSERNLLREHLSQERNLNQDLKQELEKLQFDRLEAVNKFTKEKEVSQRLRGEVDTLSDDLRRLRSQELQRDHDREVDKMTDRKNVRDIERQKEDFKMKLHEHQLESQRLSQKASSLEEQLAVSRENELKAIRELEQQKLRNMEVQERHADMVSVQTSPRKDEQQFDDQRERQRVYRSQLDSMCQSLHYLLLRYREQLNKASHKSRQLSDQDDLNTVQTSLYDLRQELKALQELEGDFMSHPAASVNERILRQNEELTNFVARISEEKTELRNALTQLEEEVWKYRKMDAEYQEIQRGLEGSDQILTKERARWSKEKLNLQMALNSAEHEINLLQSDLRVERERRVAAGMTEATRDADKMKIQRLYGKFLRAESFRKALIYQKKYLLLLLGGFRDTEETTLSLLSRMGAVDTYSRHSKQPKTTFRGAVRVVVAICRMKYLVKKWKRATRVGSEVVGGTFDENEGYNPQNTAYSPPSPPRHTTTSSRVAPPPVRSATPTLRSSPRRQQSPLRSSDTMVYLGRRDAGGVESDGYSSSSYHSPRTTTRSTFTNVPFTPPTKDYSSSPASYTSSTTPGARRKLLTSGRILSAEPRSYSPSRNGVSGDTNDYAHRLENLQNRLGKLQTDRTDTRRYSRRDPWR